VKRWIAFVIAASVACGVGARPVAPAGRAPDGHRARIVGRMKELLLAPVAQVIKRELAVRAWQLTADLRDPLVRALASEATPTRATLLARLGEVTDQLIAERTDGHVSAMTVEALRELRVAYQARCTDGCTRDAIFAELTKQLLAAYLAHGDPASAMAERQLLATLRPTLQTR
jgi:hypothetical protein